MTAEPAHGHSASDGAHWRGTAGRVIASGAWVAIAGTGLALVLTLAGITAHPLHAVFQMVMPFVLLGVSTVLLFAALTTRRALSVACGLTLVVTAAIVAPAAWPRSHPAAADTDLTIFVANLRYNNATPQDMVRQVVDAEDDVLVLVELTPDLQQELDDAGIAERFPYRFTQPEIGAHGAGVYSTLPLADARLEPIGNLVAPAATVDTPDGPVRIVAVHTRPPLSGEYLPVWTGDLDSLHAYAAALTQPTVLAGDYNATRWHPAFHDILSAGLVDAHEQLGDGLTFSWPADGRAGRFIGPFARLDHTLLFQVDATTVQDRPSTGSDHVPFSLRVRARPTDTLTP